MSTTRKVAQPILILTDNEDDISEEADVSQGQIINAAVDVQLVNDKVDPVKIDITIPGDEPLKSDEEFWELIATIKWEDRRVGERYNPPLGILANMKPAKKESLKTYTKRYMDELEEAFENAGVWGLIEARTLQDSEKAALLSHVVARGQVYYVNMKNDPIFACGLVSNNPNADAFKNFMAEF